MNEYVLVYLDDILVFSESAAEHLQHVEHVLQRLCEQKWYAKRKKCEFAKTTARYLGHVVGGGRVRVDPAKTEAVATWPQPKTVHEL